MPLLDFPTFIVGAAAGTIAAYWKDIGGAAMSFHILRTVVFGRTLRTVQYPTGELRTIVVRLPTLFSLKKNITKAYATPKFNDMKPVDFDDIHQVSKWVDNYWTEPLRTLKDMRQLDDNQLILWSSNPYEIIPLRGVDKSTLLSNQAKPVPVEEDMESLMTLLLSMSESKDPEEFLNQSQVDALTDLASSNDHQLLQFYRAYAKDSPKEFRKYALKRLQKVEAAKKM